MLWRQNPRSTLECSFPRKYVVNKLIMARDRASAIYNWDAHPTRPSNGQCQAANARPSLGQASVAASKSASDPSSTCVMGSAIRVDMSLSENSVPLNPMVNDHYPY